MLHKNGAAGDIHSLANWIVANNAARVAIVPVAGDVHKLLYQTDTGAYYMWTGAWVQLNPTGFAPYVMPLAASDEVTAITVGAGKVLFRMPKSQNVFTIKASLTAAQVSGAIFTVDVKKNGASVFAVALTIDNTEKTSASAATAAVLNTNAFLDDDEISIDVTQVGDGTAKGLKLSFIGTMQ